MEVLKDFDTSIGFTIRRARAATWLLLDILSKIHPTWRTGSVTCRVWGVSFQRISQVLIYFSIKEPLQINQLTTLQFNAENIMSALSNALLNVLDGEKQELISHFCFCIHDYWRSTLHFHKAWSQRQNTKDDTSFPFISNLDTVCKEKGDELIERTSRQWTYSLTLEDGHSIKSNEVNCGFDQKASIGSPAKWTSGKTCTQGIQDTNFPFTLREARFRESIGPPSVTHISSEIKSCLAIFDSLSSQDAREQEPFHTCRQENATKNISSKSNGHSSLSSTESQSTSSSKVSNREGNKSDTSRLSKENET
jgi:hypothetical protein